MLYVLFQSVYTEDEAAEITKRKLINNTKAEFLTQSRNHDLNNDEFFSKCCLEIDRSDIPFPNVLRDLPTGQTHSFDRISGGIMSLWLMYNYNDIYLFPSCYFGENCYQIVLDISKDKDIYIYEDSGMMDTKELSACTGVFTDMKTGKIVGCSNHEAFYYTAEMGY